MNKKLLHECNVCHGTTLCYSSCDENYDPETGRDGTGSICPTCAKSMGYVKCHYCGDMRDPMNVVQKEHYCYCISCFEDAFRV